MKTEIVNKYYKKCVDSGANTIFALYALFLIVFYFIYIFILHKNPDFFLTDDGYYTYGKLMFEGKISFLYQSRGPGLYLLFAVFNFFPEYLHPFMRILLTISVVYGNIYFASKIFKKILNKEQFFWGLLIAVFNPLNIHFTIKNTPEVYLTFIMGFIVFFYLKYTETSKSKFIILLTAGILIGMAFKPVFFLIPIFMLFQNIFILKRKKYYIAISVLIVISISSYFLFQTYTREKEADRNSYGFKDILSRVYLYDAMAKTGEINLGTSEELQKTRTEKSNYYLCFDYYEKWLKEYNKDHIVNSEATIAIDFTKDNFMKSVLLRVTSPVLFFSLTSNTFETILYFFLYGGLIVLSISCIKKVYRNFRVEISGIVSILLGYAFVFFLTLSYARYSIPLIFFLLMFTGIFFEKYFSRIFLKRENA
jgi:hypothetical protein